MPLRPIVLSVKRGRFRQDDDHAMSADAAFREVREQVLVRDNRSCVFCGFSSDRWMDVHHVNGDHHDNSLGNLVTACKLCHACHHMGLAGMNNGAFLAYIPELSQAMLNRLLRACYVADILSGGAHKDSKTLWEFLHERRAVAAKAIGTADPVALANALMRAPEDDYANRDTTLAPIRMVVKPNSKMMKAGDGRIVDFWARNVYGKVPLNVWPAIADQVFARQK